MAAAVSWAPSVGAAVAAAASSGRGSAELPSVASRADWSGVAAAASAGSCAGVAVRATGCTSGQFGQLGPQSRFFLLHLAHLVGPLGQPPAPPPVGTCGGGCWASPAASPVGANGRRRSVGSGGRMPGGACSFAPSIWSGAACLPNRDQRLPHQVHCSYPVGQNSARRLTSSHPIQETFCDRALAQRRLLARAQALARRMLRFCYN